MIYQGSWGLITIFKTTRDSATNLLGSLAVQDGIAVATFELTQSASKKKVVDLCIVESRTYDNLIFDLVWNDGNQDATEITMGEIYLKVISDRLFIPVNDVGTKDRKYAPFHAFAHYFQTKGYAGIPESVT